MGIYESAVTGRNDFRRPRIEYEANARLIAASPKMLAALTAASGYLLNAKIDLETGCPKATAIRTIEGGLRLVREAIESVAKNNALASSDYKKQVSDPQ